MSDYTKGPGASDAQGPMDQDNAKFNAFVEEMEGWGWLHLTGEAFESARWFVHQAMVFGEKFATVVVDRDESCARNRTVWLDCRWKGRVFSLIITGWEPQARIGALELLQSIHRLWESDPEQESAVSTLRTLARDISTLSSAGRRTLLTDFKAASREMADDMAREMRSRGAECERLFDLLERAQGLRGAIPKAAVIFLRATAEGGPDGNR